MSDAYAKFWKCALQVNPWTYSKQFQGATHGLTEDAYNTAIADACIKHGIQVVGIADHGSVDSLDALRKALETRSIVVFPGFEIASTEKVHMVCLYPSGTSISALNQFLGALEIKSGQGTYPSTLGCTTIAEKVQKQGGFWYAAHVTGANGLLRLNQDGGGLTHIWQSSSLVMAAQIPADIASIPDPEVQKILNNKNPQYRRSKPIALLNCKDVRQPGDLDNARTASWIKMTSPTLEALSLACRDPESRVRQSHEIDPTYYSYIERIALTRGYLEDLDLTLSPNLNAIVGGRGTGKSTLVEAIRFALDLKPASKDALRAHQGIIEANFAKEKAGIAITVTSFQQNSERYVISRYFGEAPKVLDESGSVLKLSPSDVLPQVEVYGQNELLSIVQDDNAKATLLSRFLPDDAPLQAAMHRLREALQANRRDIDALEVKVKEITGTLEQLPALIEKEKSFKKLGLETQLNQVKIREAKRAYVRDIDETLSALANILDSFRTSLSDIEIPPPPTEFPPEAVAALTKTLATAKNAVTKTESDAQKALDAARKALAKETEAFFQTLSEEEQAFNVAVNKLPTLKGKSVPQLTSEYKKVSGDIAKLKPLNATKTACEARSLTLNQARQNLLEQYAQARGSRWTELGKAVKQLNKRLAGQLRVDFEPGRVRAPLKDFIMSCQLDGVGEKRLSWLDEADNVSVSELVSLIQKGSDALLGTFKAFGMQRQAAEALAGLTPSRVRALEEVELPERMELLLNVSPEGETFREVGRLSTGQQCTAVLHLLLLDNRDPLVIDQPEDNLDNAFIADHIVNELRRSKTKRQFLFATHNANIPVFGDAEWIGVLHEEEGKSKLQASGSIDSIDVRDLAANILEGGKEAFSRRREKYGL